MASTEIWQDSEGRVLWFQSQSDVNLDDTQGKDIKQGSANIFWKETDNKYFKLTGHSVSVKAI